MFRLEGKVAVVTGGGSGIGQSIARLFAGRGAKVAVLDVDEDGAAETCKKQGDAGELFALRCDVSDAASVEAAFDSIKRVSGKIDILVNNAGVPLVGNLLQTTERDFSRLFEINVKGVFLCSKAVLPLMLEQGRGVILNMASVASIIGIADRFAYSMTKGAVLTMTLSTSIDYCKRGIRCNCICPTRIHTPFVDAYVRQNFPGKEAEVMKSLHEYQPIGRMGTPDEVAALALFLCSDEAGMITGAAYPIDGGALSQ